MNDFIKRIINKNCTSDDIYYMLKYVDVEKDTKLYKDIEKFYQEFLVSLNNSLVRFETRKMGIEENTTHYIAFYTDKKADFLEAVKVYFPVKYEYMVSALKTVFLYLIRNNIQASVKFHVKATNEGIVIRFYNGKDVLPFVQYCNNNFKLKDLLLKGNPFMGKIFGMGMVKDDNETSTFNGTLSILLAEYINYIKNNNSYEQACDLDFLDYVIKRGNIEENTIFKFNIRAVEKSIKSILNKENPIG